MANDGAIHLKFWIRSVVAECRTLNPITFAISSTLEGRNVGFEGHEFERTFQTPWYYWWAASVSIPVPWD
jgi:hypothetical protein